MTDDAQTTPGGEAVPTPPTLLTRLREKRAALGDKKTTTLDVPGYDGELCVRYRWRPYEELAQRGRQLQKVKDPTRRDMLAAADTLITLCDGIFMRVDGELVSLAPEDEDEVRYDGRLAEALGFHADDARGAVFGVFSNDYAVLTQAMQLSVWLQDTTQEVDSDFQGS